MAIRTRRSPGWMLPFAEYHPVAVDVAEPAAVHRCDVAAVDPEPDCVQPRDLPLPLGNPNADLPVFDRRDGEHQALGPIDGRISQVAQDLALAHHCPPIATSTNPGNVSCEGISASGGESGPALFRDQLTG
jgi:hypothetical protein